MKKNYKIKIYILIMSSLVIFCGVYAIHSYYIGTGEKRKTKTEVNNKKEKDSPVDKDVETNIQISSVKNDTIKLIMRVHEELNSNVCNGNKPSDTFCNNSKEYATQLNEAANQESWNYIKYDLQHAASNLEYYNESKDINGLKLAHRILHDLDVHVFNKNESNSMKDFFGDSQTYRLTHSLPSGVPDKLPPPGV